LLPVKKVGRTPATGLYMLYEVGWLVGCLVGWLVVWLVGWVVGWVVG